MNFNWDKMLHLILKNVLKKKYAINSTQWIIYHQASLIRLFLKSLLLLKWEKKKILQKDFKPTYTYTSSDRMFLLDSRLTLGPRRMTTSPVVYDISPSIYSFTNWCYVKEIKVN
jgi:hypothetical protein